MIVNTVNAAYSAQIQLNAERERERKPHHYPSSACGYDANGKFCGACRRQTWFSWKGMKKSDPIDAPALFKMNVGDIIHDHLAALIEKKFVEEYGIEVTDEVGSVGHELPFAWKHGDLLFQYSGRMDGRYVFEQGVLGVEWKSTYGKGADYIKKDGPKEDALLQCAIYLEQDVLPVDEIANMYVCRDSGYFLGFTVSKDPVDGRMLVEFMSSGATEKTLISFDGIVRATAELESHLDADTVPPKDYGSHNPDKDNKWRCQYCSYAGLCEKYEVNGERALIDAKPDPIGEM